MLVTLLVKDELEEEQQQEEVVQMDEVIFPQTHTQKYHNLVTVVNTSNQKVWVPVDVPASRRAAWADEISHVTYGIELVNGEINYIPRHIIPDVVLEYSRSSSSASSKVNIVMIERHLYIGFVQDKSTSISDPETSPSHGSDSSHNTSPISGEGESPDTTPEAGPSATSTPEQQGATSNLKRKAEVSFTGVPEMELDKQDWKVHRSLADIGVDTSTCVDVDHMEDDEVEVSRDMMESNKAGLQKPVKIKDRSDYQPRPVYSRGPPDFACPKFEVTSYRDSGANFQPIYPAGVRKGDRRLPEQYRRLGDPNFELGRRVDPEIWENRDKIFQRGNTADFFVVTGPCPMLKGVKMAYLYTAFRRYFSS